MLLVFAKYDIVAGSFPPPNGAMKALASQSSRTKNGRRFLSAFLLTKEIALTLHTVQLYFQYIVCFWHYYRQWGYSREKSRQVTPPWWNLLCSNDKSNYLYALTWFHTALLVLHPAHIYMQVQKFCIQQGSLSHVQNQIFIRTGHKMSDLYQIWPEHPFWAHVLIQENKK